MEYFATFSGEEFDPNDPNADKIHIEDIAHALSLLCRANGQIIRFYSVAQHCINCTVEAKARGLSARVQLACLLHDASEAYLSDITRPVKRHLPEYKKMEKRLQDTIYNKFLITALSGEELALVDRIDNDILVSEFDVLMRRRVYDSKPELHSTPSFDLRDFKDVENTFLAHYYGDGLKIWLSGTEDRLS